MESYEVSTWDTKNSLSKLCRLNKACGNKLQKFLPKQIWSKSDREDVLEALAELFLSGDAVVDVSNVFEPIVLEIASRSKQRVLKNGCSGRKDLQKFAFVLSKVISTSLELRRFAVGFLRQHKPFSHNVSESTEPVQKKARHRQVCSD
ncbi:midasin [Aplysia californica]|uniref:Midasin n=1 Tax=Aplysia californica TaxID=6500 RepID=A0ABM1A5E4_APLCA|nr:midasin [Aplysia californica]